MPAVGPATAIATGARAVDRMVRVGEVIQ